MKASRPSRVITNASDTPQQGRGWVGLLQRQANNILTAVLVIAAIYMLIRWRMRTAEAAKLSINNELMSAQSQVSQLRDILLYGYPPSDLLKRLNLLENGANGAVSNVLNSSDADARMRAEAFIARGDMYWYLANLPSLPGSDKDPALAVSESKASLLQKAWDAYQEVVKNSTYADQHDALAAAHLGLGAIAENRGDWSAAQHEFESVSNDGKALSVLADRAKVQKEIISMLREKLYVASPEGNPVTTPPPMTPATIPSTVPTSQPATRPSTLPASAN